MTKAPYGYTTLWDNAPWNSRKYLNDSLTEIDSQFNAMNNKIGAPGGAVSSVAGKTGAVTLNTADLTDWTTKSSAFVKSVNGVGPDSAGRVVFPGAMYAKSVNGVKPDDSGNIVISAGAAPPSNYISLESRGDSRVGYPILDSSVANPGTALEFDKTGTPNVINIHEAGIYSVSLVNNSPATIRLEFYAVGSNLPGGIFVKPSSGRLDASYTGWFQAGSSIDIKAVQDDAAAPSPWVFSDMVNISISRVG